MANTTGGARAVCPFFQHDSRFEITCEGLTAEDQLQIKFRTEMKKENYLREVCCTFCYEKRCPVAHMLEEKWKAWKQAGVLCSEMESAALFVVSSVLGLRAGALFAVLWNQERKNAGLPDPHWMARSVSMLWGSGNPAFFLS